MRLQLLSDLHLETETFEPRPASDAEALVLAGDVDSSWRGLEAFKGWPVPVLFVPGNHEYDGRDIDEARRALRALSDRLGLLWLDESELLLTDRQGRQLRFIGSTRWTDFDVFGAAQRERTMRAAGYFQRVMAATRAGQPFDAAAVRAEGLRCKVWLKDALQRADTRAAATVVVTHFAPSLKSADPRYGRQPGTGSFCNNDEDLLPLADCWLHGHLHCRYDYHVDHARGRTRVVCNARGLAHKGESQGCDDLLCVDV